MEIAAGTSCAKMLVFFRPLCNENVRNGSKTACCLEEIPLASNGVFGKVRPWTPTYVEELCFLFINLFTLLPAFGVQDLAKLIYLTCRWSSVLSCGAGPALTQPPCRLCSKPMDEVVAQQERIMQKWDATCTCQRLPPQIILETGSS